MTGHPMTPEVLRERWIGARRHSVELCARASAAAGIATERVAHARRLGRLGGDRRVPAATGAFEVSGVVDGRTVSVTWTAGRLAGDAGILDRVELVVALAGLAAEPGIPLPSLTASRRQALLAVVRAFDRVRGVRLCV